MANAFADEAGKDPGWVLVLGRAIGVDLMVCLRTGGGVELSSVSNCSIGGGVGSGSDKSVGGSGIGVSRSISMGGS